MLCSTFTNNETNFLRRRRSIGDGKEPESTALVGTDKMETESLREQINTLKTELENVYIFGIINIVVEKHFDGNVMEKFIRTSLHLNYCGTCLVR